MKGKMVQSLFLGMVFLGMAGSAHAHFGMLIPAQPRMEPENKQLTLTLSFSHPFEGQGMDLARPAGFFVVQDGKKQDLASALTETKVMGHTAWQAQFPVSRPGVYQFAMEPQPYWEPAEDVSIIHYTKVIVPAFGDDGGWDEPLGLPTEIVALTRPFGNYAGNSFSGQVLAQGKPVPGAEVEIELYNDKGGFKAPSDYHVTQVVKADGNGVFSFTCPQAGWWGFAALSEAPFKLKDPGGVEKGVELGAVLWVYMDPWQQGK